MLSIKKSLLWQTQNTTENQFCLLLTHYEETFYYISVRLQTVYQQYLLKTISV